MLQEKPFVGLLRVLTGLASYLPSPHRSWLGIRQGSMFYIKHFIHQWPRHERDYAEDGTAKANFQGTQ